MSAKRRLQKELKQLTSDPIPGILAIPTDNLFQWKAVIDGPLDTPYAGGKFYLDVKFSDKYPFKSPILSFITKILHPNISCSGGLCLDILQEAWCPSQTIRSVLLSVQSLLNDPNPHSPLNSDIARVYINDRKKFNQMVIEYVKKYAC